MSSTRASHLVLGGLALLSTAALLFLAALFTPAFAGDTITVTSGGKDNVLSEIQIDKIERDKIYFFNLKGGGAGAASKPMSEVKEWKIDYSERHKALGRAYDHFKSARWAEAIAAAKELLDATNPKPQALELHLATMFICEAGAKLGDGESVLGKGYDVAIKYVPELDKNFPQSYYLVDAFESLGIALQCRKKAAEAEAAYRRMESLDPARGGFRLALILYENKKFSQARDQFKKAQALAARGDNKRMAELCEVYVAKSSIEMNDPDAAKEIFQRLSDGGGSNQPEVLGAAYLGIGSIQGSKGDFENAFMALAKASTVFKSALSPEELQRAIGLSAVAAAKLASSGKADWQEVADRLRQEYERRYPRQPMPSFR